MLVPSYVSAGVRLCERVFDSGFREGQKASVSPWDAVDRWGPRIDATVVKTAPKMMDGDLERARRGALVSFARGVFLGSVLREIVDG